VIVYEHYDAHSPITTLMTVLSSSQSPITTLMTVLSSNHSPITNLMTVLSFSSVTGLVHSSESCQPHSIEGGATDVTVSTTEGFALAFVLKRLDLLGFSVLCAVQFRL
jgi:hypothetical protein